MVKLHKADSLAAHVARILVILVGSAEFWLVVSMFLVMTCVGWDEEFNFSIIMVLTIPYAFTILLVIGVAFLPFARSWERGVVLGLVVFEFAAMFASIAASIWRGILYGDCTDDACKHDEDGVLVLLIINIVLAVLSAFNMAFALLLYTNVRRNPYRAAAIKAKAELAPNPRIEIVAGEDSEFGHDDGEEKKQKRPPRRERPPPVPRDEEDYDEEEQTPGEEEDEGGDEWDDADDEQESTGNEQGEEGSVLATLGQMHFVNNGKKHNVSTGTRNRKQAAAQKHHNPAPVHTNISHLIQHTPHIASRHAHFSHPSAPSYAHPGAYGTQHTQHTEYNDVTDIELN